MCVCVSDGEREKKKVAVRNETERVREGKMGERDWRDGGEKGGDRQEWETKYEYPPPPKSLPPP